MRVVLDASACVEFLLGTSLGAQVAALLIEAETIHAPDLLVSEVLSALRGLLRGGQVGDLEARMALRALADLDVELVSALSLAAGVWGMVDRHSSYDAHYVALARAVGGTLVTTDARLARAATTAAIVILQPV